MAGGFRTAIPNNVKKTIQNIKEIASNHTDDEIYAMLKECSMDPNETVQKLLYQDTFHEVKRKRDKRKENQNMNNREPTDSRWRPSMQGRGGGRGGRGGYSSRYISHDAVGGRNTYAGKENGVITERGITSTSSPVSQDAENKATIPVSSHTTGMADGPSDAGHGSSSHGHGSQVSGSSGNPTPQESSAVGVNKTGGAPAPGADVESTTAITSSGPLAQPTSDQFSATTMPGSVSGVYSSASDPVLVPSLDTRDLGVVGTIKREVGSQRTTVEPAAMVTTQSKPVSQESTNRPKISKIVSRDVTDSEHSSSVNEKAASESRNLFMHGKISNKSQGVERNQLVEASQATSPASHTGSSSSRPSSNYGSRPSSNYGNRSQQVIGPQKAVGPSKEWKPKPVNPNIVQSSSEATPPMAEVGAQSLPSSATTGSEVTTSKLQKKLEDIHLSDNQHVIIPNHLHVPESERSGLSFGSFDASFGLNTSFENGPDTENSSTPLSESSQVIEELTEDPSSSNQNTSATAHDGDYSDQPQSPTHMPENLMSAEADASVGLPPMPEYDQSKPETVLPQGGLQYSVVHTSPSYSTLGVIPPILGSQFPPFESSEPQARDASRIPSFVVQQPFDPSTSYYTQFYRPTEGDGRFSPFLSPGNATKYNGNIAVLSSQTGQSQESGNSLVLSTAGPTLVTQAAGVMQSTIAVTQQPLPVFRQPAGVHLSHYPPNCFPYSQYYPFYVQPPAIHHFLSNTAFPQTGNIYPPPAAAAAAPTALKYSLSQYKPGSNTGNATHVGMPAGYGPYGSTPTGYSPNPASTTGNSTGNEDLAASQYKENNVYMTGQQSEGSAVWVHAPGRDISTLQANSYYNLPPQGQHVAFTPAQAGHSAFAGIYHPAQAVTAATVHPLLQQPQTMAGAVEVGPPAGIYQQPQRTQINWTNNY